MALFNNKKEPIFLKESSSLEAQIDSLRKLEPLLNSEGKNKLKQELRFLEYGLAGEKNIAFELKNSHMFMYILHDIYLECDGLTAQIDYLIFTPKLCFVVECKNLVGNIEITANGDFIRTTEYKGIKRKEGIYSPITQNERHIDLLKRIKREKHSNLVMKTMSDLVFSSFNKSIVVLANPKTILNAKYAKKEIRNQVIRADQLINYIKEQHKNSQELKSSQEDTYKMAMSHLKLHIENENDYSEKYLEYMIENRNQKPEHAEEENIKSCELNSIINTLNIEETEIYQELKAYRLRKSSEEQVKAYQIYSNNQLKDLIEKMPLSIEELMKVNGFGEVKAGKYGEEIIEIVNKHRMK